MSVDPVRRPDGRGWVLPVAGQQVTRLAFDYQTRLLFENGVEVVLESPFELGGPVAAVIRPEDVESLAPALRLLRQVAAEAHADDDGRLNLTFRSGLHLRAGYDDSYESWQALGPLSQDRQPWLLVVGAGGGLAVGPSGERS